MADNIAVTAGSGTTVATDDVAGVHFQKVKIVDGTADSSTALKVVTEDSAHVSGDTGILAMAVRTDTASARAASDGDNIPLTTDNAGRLHVYDKNSDALLTAMEALSGGMADDAAFTPATSEVSPIGFFADDASTDSVDEGDIGAARMTLDRKQIVTPQPHTAGGLSIFRSIDLDETEEEIKATAGCLYSMWVTNLRTSTLFLKFYNATAANVTVGTTTPVITIGIPGNTSDDVAGLFSSTHGIMFDTAITAAVTTGIADNDTGAPGANEFILNAFYK